MWSKALTGILPARALQDNRRQNTGFANLAFPCSGSVLTEGSKHYWLEMDMSKWVDKVLKNAGDCAKFLAPFRLVRQDYSECASR